MASTINTLSVTLFFSLILFARPAFSADSPESSPSPSPQPPATPSPSPAIANSPPAPPPPDLAPDSHSPAPSPGESDAGNKKAPSPAVAGGIGHSSADDLERKDDSSGGLSGGKKAGIAFGVIGAVAVVVIGAVVYKKRQHNIQRSQYGNAARREML